MAKIRHGRQPWDAGPADDDAMVVRDRRAAAARRWRVVTAPRGWEVFEGRRFSRMALREGLKGEGAWPAGMTWEHVTTGKRLVVVERHGRRALRPVQQEKDAMTLKVQGLTSRERLEAIRAAYAGLSPDEQAEVDAWVVDLKRAMKAKRVRNFGDAAALELLAALVIWALENEAARQTAQYEVRKGGLVLEEV